MRKTHVLVAAVLCAAVVGCKKKEETTSGGSPGSTVNVGVQGGQVATREESGITRYSDEGPESGTVFVKKPIIIRAKADNESAIVGRAGPGTAVNKKARHGAFYLVDFPSGPGQMTPGWLDQDEVTGTPVVAHTTVTTTTTPPPTPPAATTPAPPGGRPPGPIKIQKK
jgi:hypothetical protein